MSDILFVSATAKEAAYLPDTATVLITGVGFVNAATTLATYLADPRTPRPGHIVNVGTAGALREGLRGVYEIHEVIQHDLSQEALEEMTGRPFPNARQLQPETTLPAASLASGSAFVDSDALRAELAERADLVDMEGYMVARLSAAFDIPVTLIKQVSDQANEQSREQWPLVVDASARELQETLEAQGWI